MKFEDLLLVLLVLCFGYLLELFGNLFIDVFAQSKSK